MLKSQAIKKSARNLSTYLISARKFKEIPTLTHQIGKN